FNSSRRRRTIFSRDWSSDVCSSDLNTFRLSDGLFLEACRAVAKDFPEVETDDVIVDAMAALLVRQPERYDVICATNFHSDILSDLASELSGSLGLAGSVNAGDELCCAQAQHGSAQIGRASCRAR